MTQPSSSRGDLGGSGPSATAVRRAAPPTHACTHMDRLHHQRSATQLVPVLLLLASLGASGHAAAQPQQDGAGRTPMQPHPPPAATTSNPASSQPGPADPGGPTAAGLVGTNHTACLHLHGRDGAPSGAWLQAGEPWSRQSIWVEGTYYSEGVLKPNPWPDVLPPRPRWQTFTDPPGTCEMLDLLARGSRDLAPGSILIIGDSIDRMLVDDVAMLHNATQERLRTDDWAVPLPSGNGHPWWVTIATER